ncbi:hypothetical protein NKH98_28195 [Mesorhizobium sp. M0833]|uniref:hypothetical protein n=1 Tax=Mesorhizobium sp. M0833 TaxID=2957009 RepID=UPI003335DF86
MSDNEASEGRGEIEIKSVWRSFDIANAAPERYPPFAGGSLQIPALFVDVSRKILAQVE